LLKDSVFLESETTVPIALNAIALGLAGSELLMANPACLLFLAIGVKVTEIVQLAFGVNEPPQVLVSEKSLGSIPPIKILSKPRTC